MTLIRFQGSSLPAASCDTDQSFVNPSDAELFIRVSAHNYGLSKDFGLV